MVPSLVEDGYIDHFEVYEEILSPQFIRKHYSFVEAVAAAGRKKKSVVWPWPIVRLSIGASFFPSPNVSPSWRKFFQEMVSSKFASHLLTPQARI